MEIEKIIVTLQEEEVRLRGDLSRVQEALSALVEGKTPQPTKKATENKISPAEEVRLFFNDQKGSFSRPEVWNSIIDKFKLLNSKDRSHIRSQVSLALIRYVKNGQIKVDKNEKYSLKDGWKN